jgi:hypothetical protein
MTGTTHKVFPVDGGFRLGWAANVVITKDGEALGLGSHRVAELLAQNAEQLWIIDERGPLFQTEAEALNAIYGHDEARKGPPR